jgi:hypothetical protein
MHSNPRSKGDLIFYSYGRGSRIYAFFSQAVRLSPALNHIQNFLTYYAIDFAILNDTIVLLIHCFPRRMHGLLLPMVVG